MEDDNVVDTPTEGTPEGGASDTPQEPASLRDSLESAIETAEEKHGKLEGEEGGDTPPATEALPEAQSQQASQAQSPTQQAPVDDAPRSWKPATRAKWAALDPEVKAEVLRRDREVTRAIGESSSARQFANNFVETLRPYEARIRSMGSNPIEMAGRLFQADYVLATGSPVTAARYMADLIKTYGIDIKELDNALAGAEPEDPVAARLDQMLNQRLAPVGQFLQQQQQVAAQQDYMRAQAAQGEVEAMAADPKFPHMEAVRNDMADLIDFYSAKGVYLTLETAYNRAVALNPELGAQVARQQLTQQASTMHARTRKAQAASLSVSGAPGGSPANGKGGGSIRDAVEAAWIAHSGR